MERSYEIFQGKNLISQFLVINKFQIVHVLDRCGIYLFICGSYTPWLFSSNFSYLALIWVGGIFGSLFSWLYYEQYKVRPILQDLFLESEKLYFKIRLPKYYSENIAFMKKITILLSFSQLSCIYFSDWPLVLCFFLQYSLFMCEVWHRVGLFILQEFYSSNVTATSLLLMRFGIYLLSLELLLILTFFKTQFLMTILNYDKNFLRETLTSDLLI